MAAPITVNVGHTIGMSLIFKNQNGVAMAITPTPDSPPVWSNTAADVDTLAPSADGLTCVDTAVAAGSDTVSVAVVVSGVTFNAQLPVTVTVPDVLTSIDIVPVISA